MNHDTETTVLLGTVVFLKTNLGSKSEGVFPFLYQDQDRITKIRLQNDNPFENRGLRPFDGKAVEIRGSAGRGNIFLISEIRPLIPEKTESAPAAPAPAESVPENDNENDH